MDSRKGETTTPTLYYPAQNRKTQMWLPRLLGTYLGRMGRHKVPQAPVRFLFTSGWPGKLSCNDDVCRLWLLFTSGWPGKLSCDDDVRRLWHLSVKTLVEQTKVGHLPQADARKRTQAVSGSPNQAQYFPPICPRSDKGFRMGVLLDCSTGHSTVTVLADKKG